MIPGILATLASGIFTGAAIYVNLVEQPARLSCGIALAITEWRPSYRRGSVMQASLAVSGSVLAFLSAWISRDPRWIVGGILLFAVVPFTLIVIFPTNKKLQSQRLDITTAHSEHLLRLWNRLHAVRSGLGLLAFLVFLFALQHSSG
jgi:anthrone oxygenase-like protein